ncbi:hypothetical protein BDQ94DRAFT_155730 [Aspergillus welwitschiae]|uniref:Uncharacterized protein n=1 Tax=Aspergillus welwitschiae TaxID=1341132 RepID=A0A3F3PHJ4_9EURO|nr:hypothetical protein BDQ94DRAFT_155730 [Aspergillus welwitschiae]RDH26327.1 hypothetical protein BDQ94DRAFT_155730 [Aspergillus welwitschiae]
MSHPALSIPQHGAESGCAKVNAGLRIRVLMRASASRNFCVSRIQLNPTYTSYNKTHHES